MAQTSFSIKEKYESELLDILNNPNYASIPFIERGFVSIGAIPHSSLLFIGINPSFQTKATPNELDYYCLKPDGNDYKRYFGKFEQLAHSANLPLGHMDMLYFRETKQNNIDEIMSVSFGREFIVKQLEISKNILENVKPKIIVVCNTKARQLLGKDKNNGSNLWLNYDFEFDENIGTHRITTPNSSLNNTPVFFTSMLTGQRALDTGSYERLLWHIKKVANAV